MDVFANVVVQVGGEGDGLDEGGVPEPAEYGHLGIRTPHFPWKCCTPGTPKKQNKETEANTQCPQHFNKRSK